MSRFYLNYEELKLTEANTAYRTANASFYLNYEELKLLIAN